MKQKSGGGGRGDWKEFNYFESSCYSLLQINKSSSQFGALCTEIQSQTPKHMAQENKMKNERKKT